MRPKHVFALAGLHLLARISSYAGRHPQRHRQPPTKICLSASLRRADALEALGKAKQTVLVQAYSFTSAPISKAMVDAHKRGVKVTAVLDKSQETEKYSSATFVANAGIPVFIDDKHQIAHNKIILIDDATIITGSFNFTKSAEENNAENLLVIEGKPKLMVAYQKDFKEHMEYSHEYKGRTE